MTVSTDHSKAALIETHSGPGGEIDSLLNPKGQIAPSTFFSRERGAQLMKWLVSGRA
jgi:hypothetical protein